MPLFDVCCLSWNMNPNGFTKNGCDCQVNVPSIFCTVSLIWVRGWKPEKRQPGTKEEYSFIGGKNVMMSVIHFDGRGFVAIIVGFLWDSVDKLRWMSPYFRSKTDMERHITTVIKKWTAKKERKGEKMADNTSINDGLVFSLFFFFFFCSIPFYWYGNGCTRIWGLIEFYCLIGSNVHTVLFSFINAECHLSSIICFGHIEYWTVDTSTKIHVLCNQYIVISIGIFFFNSKSWPASRP